MATTGTLTFTARGPVSQTLTVNVIADARPEHDETFRVLIASDGAAVIDGEGMGTIVVETIHETGGGGNDQGQLASDRRSVVQAGVYVALAGLGLFGLGLTTMPKSPGQAPSPATQPLPAGIRRRPAPRHRR